MKFNWKEEVSIFGFLKTRREVFWNGIVFVFLSAVYNAFLILSNVPSNWADMTPEEADKIEIEISFWQQAFSVLIMLSAYWLLSKALLRPTIEVVKNNSPGKALLQRIYIIAGVVIVSSLLQILGITLIL